MVKTNCQNAQESTRPIGLEWDIIRPALFYGYLFMRMRHFMFLSQTFHGSGPKLLMPIVDVIDRFLNFFNN